MVLLSAKRMADLVAGGRPLPQAGADVMAELGAARAGAGLIALGPDGGSAELHNTRFMAVARR
jgi:hypothetical protein